MKLKKNIILFLLIIIGGCQQCILEYEANPKLGFNPQSKITNSGEYFHFDLMIDDFESSFFGLSFQLTYDSTLIDSFNCTSDNIENSFFGQNYLAQHINPGCNWDDEIGCYDNYDDNLIDDECANFVQIFEDNDKKENCLSLKQNKIYSSISLINGQDPISGSGNIASCGGKINDDARGTAYIEFLPSSFYFIDEYGQELLNPINSDYDYSNIYSIMDSSSIIYDFEVINARLDINQPGIIDNQ